MKEEKINKETIDFWKDIIYKNGKIDEKQVMKELADFSFVMDQVPEVYCAITNDRMSKCSYYAKDIISTFNDLYWDKSTIQDDVLNILKQKIGDKEKLEEIEGYLELI